MVNQKVLFFLLCLEKEKGKKKLFKEPHEIECLLYIEDLII